MFLNGQQISPWKSVERKWSFSSELVKKVYCVRLLFNVSSDGRSLWGDWKTLERSQKLLCLGSVPAPRFMSYPKRIKGAVFCSLYLGLSRRLQMYISKGWMSEKLRATPTTDPRMACCAEVQVMCEFSQLIKQTIKIHRHKKTMNLKTGELRFEVLFLHIPNSSSLPNMEDGLLSTTQSHPWEPFEKKNHDLTRNIFSS